MVARGSHPSLAAGPAKAVLFTASTALTRFDGANIEVITLGDGRRKTVQRIGTYARYLPSGHLVYLHNGTLFAVPFDLDRLKMRGTPAPVLDEVAYNAAFGSAQFDFSVTPSGHGMVAYRAGAGSSLVTVQMAGRFGQDAALLARPGDYLYPRVSPDGNRLTLASAGDIWVFDWRRETMTRLTSGGEHSYPLWSPDGRYIAFRAAGGMFWTRSDGAGKPQPLTQSKNVQSPWSFAPDAKRLAFMEVSLERWSGIWTVSLETNGAGLRAGGKPEAIEHRFEERHPSFSPDGRWLAYRANESGTYQVYVRAFPDTGGKWQISNGDGVYPVWSPKGRELFFRTLDNQIMTAAYEIKGDSFVADKPRLWSEKRLANVGLFRSYDVAPDGKRIVALMPAEGLEEQKAQNHVTFLLNFFDELRRRVPTEGK